MARKCLRTFFLCFYSEQFQDARSVAKLAITSWIYNNIYFLCSLLCVDDRYVREGEDATVTEKIKFGDEEEFLVSIDYN